MKTSLKKLKRHLNILRKMKFGVKNNEIEEPKEIKKTFYQKHKKVIKKGLKITGAILTTAAVAGLAYKGHQHIQSRSGKLSVKPDTPSKTVSSPNPVEQLKKEQADAISVLKSTDTTEYTPEQKSSLRAEITSQENNNKQATRELEEQLKQAKENKEREKKERDDAKLFSAKNATDLITTAALGQSLNPGNQNPLVGMLATQIRTHSPEILKKLEELTQGKENIEAQLTEEQNKEEPDQEKIEKLNHKLEENSTEVEETMIDEVVTDPEQKTRIQDINDRLKELKKEKKTTKVKEEIKKLNKELKKELSSSKFGQKRLKFGNIKKKIYNIYHISKKKFYEISKIIAKGLLIGVGIFAGITISLIGLLKYLEYRKIKLDPSFVAKLIESTDKKGNLHVDNFVDSLGTSSTRWWDKNGTELTKKIAKEIRTEVPEVIQVATISGLEVVQANSMTLMMPMMLALSSYFSKQMQDLTIASAKKSRSDAAKLGYQNRVKKLSEERRKSLTGRRKSLTGRRKSLTGRRKSLTGRRKSVSGGSSGGSSIYGSAHSSLSGFKIKNSLKKNKSKSVAAKRRYAKQFATENINSILDNLPYNFGKRKLKF